MSIAKKSTAASRIPPYRSTQFILTQFFWICFARVSCDLFAWEVSRQFGAYGISAQGEPFSLKYWLSNLVFVFVAIVYAVFLNRKIDAFEVGLAVLLLASYIPLSTAWWITDGSSDFFAFASVFWIALLSMLLLTQWTQPTVSGDLPKPGEPALSLIFVAVLLFLGTKILLTFNLNMSFGFDTAYERRAEFAKWLESGPYAYLLSWSVYAFSCYLIFFSRRIGFKFLAVLYVLLVYAVSGAKIYVLMVPAFILIYFITTRNLAFLLAPFLVVATLASAVFFWLGEIWFPTLVQRLLILPADIAFHYVSFFPEKLLYSYSFLSGYSAYGYPELPGKIIGSAFYTAGDNATAGFLADAFVNAGWWSLVPLVLFFVALRLLFYPGAYLVILLPLVAQLLDTPLPTALLTGGGGIVIALALFMSRQSGVVGRSRIG